MGKMQKNERSIRAASYVSGLKGNIAVAILRNVWQEFNNESGDQVANFIPRSGQSIFDELISLLGTQEYENVNHRWQAS